MLVPLTPLVRFTHSAQTSGGPLLSLRTISTLKSNFSTGAQRPDEVTGAAKCAGLSKVEVPVYVLDIWKEERAQLLAEKEENAVKSAIRITKLEVLSLLPFRFNHVLALTIA